MQVTADSALRRVDQGRTAIGGSPLRILRLTDEGSRRLDAWLDGEPVGPAPADRRLLRRLLQAGLVHPVRPDRPLESTFTVVVPVCDDVAGLEALLAALGDGSPVMVVDDGSCDGEAHRQVVEAAGGFYARRGSAPTGPGSARNHGLESVATDLVAFVDADVLVSAEALVALAGHFDDPEVAAVSPRVRSQGEADGLLAAYESGHSPHDLGPEPSPVGPGRRVSYVPSACLLVRTAAARAVGGFDPDLRWGEDVDFVWRLVAEGHTVRYDPTIEVGHRPRPTLRAWLDQRRRYGSSAAPLAARHGRAVAPVRCSVWSAAAWGAALAGHPALGAGVAVGSIARLASGFTAVPGGAAEAVRLAGRGHILAGLSIARAAGRVWWPLTLGFAATGRRARAAVLAALIVPHAIEWIRRPRLMGPVPALALGLADDIAYGFGVWEGMVRLGSFAAIKPDLVSGSDRGDTRAGG